MKVWVHFAAIISFSLTPNYFIFIGYLTSEPPLDPPLCWPVTISLSQGGHFYTTLTNFDMKYLVMCKVYTNVGGIK